MASHVVAQSNGSTGIVFFRQVVFSLSSFNESAGIAEVELVQGNSSKGNGGSGISCAVCLILDNSVNSNAQSGVAFTASSGAYARNWIQGNTTAISGSGAQLGPNYCDGALCP